MAWGALAILVAVCIGLNRMLPAAPSDPGRTQAIDGVRGYLAIGVAVHHFALTWTDIATGVWGESTQPVYGPAGYVAVGVFFMITAFLFYGVVRVPTRPVVWTHFFVRRLCRLVPVYLVAMALLFLGVAALTEWRLAVEPGALVNQILRWLTFTVAGAPDVNGLARTWVLICGVTWTLRYEWAFYLAVPLIAWAAAGCARLGSRAAPVRIAVVLAVHLALCAAPDVQVARFAATYLSFFTYGMLAVELVAWPGAVRLLAGPVAGFVALAALAVALSGVLPFGSGLLNLAIFCFFLPIAANNPLFGTLTASVSQLLGNFSYGIYLMHGFVLFAGMRVFGATVFADQGNVAAWMTMPMLIAAAVGLAALVHYTIEQPGIDLGKRWTRPRPARSAV